MAGDNDLIVPGLSPEFSQPPLVEVALGVEFLPIAGLGAIQLAGLASRWSAKYPVAQEHPPLPPNPPLGAGGREVSGLVVSVGAFPIRLWLMTSTEERLVQIQRDRLVLNWRASPDVASYPRYHATLRAAFADDFERLLLFLSEMSLPAPRLVAAEATYVNLVPREGGAVPDLPDILRSQVSFDHHLGGPSSTRLHQQWEVTEEDGLSTVLSFDVDTSVELKEGAAVAMTLAARTALRSGSSIPEALRGLDVCHDHVVQSFVELTEQHRHRAWGRTA